MKGQMEEKVLVMDCKGCYHLKVCSHRFVIDKIMSALDCAPALVISPVKMLSFISECAHYSEEKKTPDEH